MRIHTFRAPLLIGSSVIAAACLLWSSGRTVPEAGSRFCLKHASVDRDHASKTSSSENKVAVNHTFGRMPLYFIENRGQLDPRVAYYVQGRDTTLYFTAQGTTLVQTGRRMERSSQRKD